MCTRRAFFRQAPALAALAGGTPGITACAVRDTQDDCEARARALRLPLADTPARPMRLLELVRCATLAANGHNTQPWRFALAADGITIHPDLSRRTPVVDPDDHHLWVSLGCATENLVIAAAALGWEADVALDGSAVHVALRAAAPSRSPLVDAIFLRQCTRAEYDGQPLAPDALQALERAGSRAGVHVQMLMGRNKLEGVLEYVNQATHAQMHDAAFRAELKHWLRFDAEQAIATGDGLSTRVSGNPAAPPWLGSLLFSLFATEASERDKAARHLRSSAGVAVLVAARADPAHWFEAGRACERFALVATSLGVRTAFVNPPVEVPMVRTQFADWLGLHGQRADLVIRFGHGPLMPYSLRRPVAEVMT